MTPFEANSVLNARDKRLEGWAYKLGPAGNQFGMDVALPAQLDVDESAMSAKILFADGHRRDGVGDLLEVGGIRTERHAANPISLFDHGQKVQLPIGLCCERDGDRYDVSRYTVTLDPISQQGTANVFFYQGKGLETLGQGDMLGVDKTTEFDHALFCEQLFHMLKVGLIRAGSFGYQVIKAQQIAPDYEKGTPQGLHLFSTLLLEVSPVILPANQDTVRKVLSDDRMCGKRLSPYLVKSLMPYAPERKAFMAVETKAKQADGRCPCGARIPSGQTECESCKFHRGDKDAEERAAAERKADNERKSLSGKDRDRLRKKQDKLIAMSVTQKFVRDHGENKPVWEGGPSVGELRSMLYPAWEGKVDQLLNEYGSKAFSTNPLESRDDYDNPLSRGNVPAPRWRPGMGASKELRAKYRKKSPSNETKSINWAWWISNTLAVLGSLLGSPSAFVSADFEGSPWEDDLKDKHKQGKTPEQAAAELKREGFNGGLGKGRKSMTDETEHKALRRLMRKDWSSGRMSDSGEAVTAEQMSTDYRAFAADLIARNGGAAGAVQAILRLIHQARQRGASSIEVRVLEKTKAEIERSGKGVKLVAKGLIKVGPSHPLSGGGHSVVNAQTGKVVHGPFQDERLADEAHRLAVKKPKSDKAMNVRKKYRPAKSLRRVVRKSAAGTSLMFCREKDLPKLKTLAAAKGVALDHLGNVKGAEKVRMKGMDDAMDEVAKAFGVPLKGLKSLRTETVGSKALKKVGSLQELWNLAQTDDKYRELLLVAARNLGGNSNNPSQAYQWLKTNAMETDERGVVNEVNFCRSLIGKSLVATKALDTVYQVFETDDGKWGIKDATGEVVGNGFDSRLEAERGVEELLMGGHRVRGDGGGLAMKEGIKKIKAQGTKTMRPTKTKALDVPDAAAADPAADPTQAIEEPLSSQAHRRMHEDASILMNEYDGWLRTMEHEPTKKYITKYLEGLGSHMDEVEKLHSTHHKDLEPIVPHDSEEESEEGEGEEDLEAEGKDLDEGEESPEESPEVDSADSEPLEEPTPEEVVEGMDTEEPATEDESFKSIPVRVSKTLRAKYKSGVNGKTKAWHKGSEEKDKDDDEDDKSLMVRKKGKCPGCGKEDCSCQKMLVRKKDLTEDEVEGIKDDLDVQEADTEEQPLEAHEKGYVKDAHGFLGELGETQDFGDEHRMKSYHYHKTLGAIAQKFMDVEDENLDDGAMQRKGDPWGPASPHDAPAAGGSPPSGGENNPEAPMQAPASGTIKGCIKSASDYFGKMSTTRDFGDPHREQAKALQKALEPFSKEDELETEDKAEDLIPEEQEQATEDFVEPGEMGQKTIPAKKKSAKDPDEDDVKSLKRKFLKEIENGNRINDEVAALQQRVLALNGALGR